MKNSAFLMMALLTSTTAMTAMADQYQVSVSDTHLGNLILAKDCLDYTLCGGEGTSLAGGNPDYRLHAFIQMSDQQLANTLNVCNFKNLGINLSIKNITQNSQVVIPSDNGKDIRPSLPSVYIKQMNAEEKVANYNAIKTLIDQKKNQEAINAVISIYGLSTHGYAIQFGGDMGNAGAVTDHETRTIRVSDSAFQHACVLIQTMRHELEHVSQIAKLNSCNAIGKSHNFIDHVTRERSAYLNDIRNIPLFCPDAYVSEQMVNGTTNVFFNSYTKTK